MKIEFCARSQEICGQSIVSIVGRPKENRPENGAVSARAIVGSDQRQRRICFSSLPAVRMHKGQTT
jgi:hypothetical protein